MLGILGHVHVGSMFNYFVAVLRGHAEAMLGHVEAICWVSFGQMLI